MPGLGRGRAFKCRNEEAGKPRPERRVQLPENTGIEKREVTALDCVGQFIVQQLHF